MKNKIIESSIEDMVPDNLNANKGTEYGQHLIEESFRKFGAGRSILLDKNNRIIAGNKCIEGAGAIGLDKVLIVETTGDRIVAVKRTDIDLDTQQGRELALADNATSKANLHWDGDAIKAIAEKWDVKPQEWGITEFSDVPPGNGDNNGSLAERFVVPPFSILDTRQGYWQDRKKVWRGMIGDMGESRNDTLITSPEMKYHSLYISTRAEREKLGISFAEYLEKHVPEEVKAKESRKVLGLGVSILDPVLSELIVHWFGVPGGNAFDCFAGDTVFGWVAGHLGQNFTGIELRKEQADINNQRVKEAHLTSRYICDDGQNVLKHLKKNSQDLLFSCPPYYDLEQYSDIENDASNQESYEDFLKIIHNAFTASIACLKDNRFAVIVISDIRTDQGNYYGLPEDVKHIFKDAGLHLYNEMILVEPIGSARLRVNKNMASRKVTKTHQNVLVFYKGNTKMIRENFKPIEYESEDLEP